MRAIFCATQPTARSDTAVRAAFHSAHACTERAPLPAFSHGRPTTEQRAPANRRNLPGSQRPRQPTLQPKPPCITRGSRARSNIQHLNSEVSRARTQYTTSLKSVKPYRAIGKSPVQLYHPLVSTQAFDRLIYYLAPDWCPPSMGGVTTPRIGGVVL